MPPTAEHCLVEPAHHLQSVAQVPAGFGFAQTVAHGPRICDTENRRQVAAQTR